VNLFYKIRLGYYLKVIVKNMPFFKRAIPSYGWLVVGASTLVMIGFYGAELSFGVFLKPLIGEFGWTRTMASGAISIVEGIGGLVGIIAGRLTDKYGARMVMAIGALLGGLGYLLMSQATSLWQMYLYFGVMGGICIGTCWTPINATVSRWFVEKRVLALGITTSGIRMGNMLLPPLIAYFIIGHGWRPAYIVLAVLVWVTAIPAVALLGRNPSQGTGVLHNSGSEGGNPGDSFGKPFTPREWSASEAAKTVQFWMLLLTGYVIAVGFFIVAVHIVAYATDIGIAATSAALILTIMGISSILGNILIWPISNRVGSRFAFLLILALQALPLFLFMQVTSLWALFVLGAVFGFGLGGTAPIRMSMVSEFFGIRSVGTIIGLVSIAWAVGGITGPVLAGYLFDVSHSYDMAFLFGGMLMIIGMAATYFLKTPKG